MLFVHIPRSGGTSINRFFYNMGAFPYKKPDRNPDYHSLYGLDSKERKLIELDHLTFEMIKQYTPYHRLSRLQKFCVVRNPYDRFLSEYNRQKKEKDKRIFSNIEDLSLEAYSEAVFALFASRKIFELSHFSQCHLIPQYEYIRDGFGIARDLRILRFETLDEGFQRLLGDLGVQSDHPLPKLNFTSKQTNIAKVPLVEQAVRALYAQDYVFLGFEE
nr:sulfotransferase family 2 domain-containing protein [Thiocystis violacea]